MQNKAQFELISIEPSRSIWEKYHEQPSKSFGVKLGFSGIFLDTINTFMLKISHQPYVAYILIRNDSHICSTSQL